MLWNLSDNQMHVNLKIRRQQEFYLEQIKLLLEEKLDNDVLTFCSNPEKGKRSMVIAHI